MERATFIGVVSDPLYERVKRNAITHSNTFNASDVDDFERSKVDGDPENEMRRKKKKRRSSSLQGLVSNLINSFTKWRRGDPLQNSRLQNPGRPQNNTSTFSNNLYTDQSTINSECEHRALPVVMSRGRRYANDDCDYEVMRKRKAGDDQLTAPFAAIIKKAILQGNSTLGITPFNTSTYLADHGDSEINIDLANANYNSKMASISPNSSKYTNNNDMSKTSNCFSTSTSNTTTTTKAPKAGVKKITGFLRRFSGSKEPLQSSQASPATLRYTRRRAPTLHRRSTWRVCPPR